MFAIGTIYKKIRLRKNCGWFKNIAIFGWYTVARELA